MSPRRAADVSFGVLLFECVTGGACSRTTATAELGAMLARAGCVAARSCSAECHQSDARKRPSSQHPLAAAAAGDAGRQRPAAAEGRAHAGAGPGQGHLRERVGASTTPDSHASELLDFVGKLEVALASRFFSMQAKQKQHSLHFTHPLLVASCFCTPSVFCCTLTHLLYLFFLLCSSLSHLFLFSQHVCTVFFSDGAAALEAAARQGQLGGIGRAGQQPSESALHARPVLSGGLRRQGRERVS